MLKLLWLFCIVDFFATWLLATVFVFVSSSVVVTSCCSLELVTFADTLLFRFSLVHFLLFDDSTSAAVAAAIRLARSSAIFASIIRSPQF